MITFTIDEVKKNPQMFMYAFADNKFVNSLGKYRAIVSSKAINQRAVLRNSADYYKVPLEKYTATIRESFNENFGMSPYKALQTLAAGGTVAGKNWAAGVYGIGTVSGFRTDFAKNSKVTVDALTGEILYNGKPITSQQEQIANGCPGNISGFTAALENGDTYSSQYYKAKNRYGAGVCVIDGQKYKANGNAATSADLSNLWEGVDLLWDKFVEALMKFIDMLFGTSQKEEVEQIEPTNTFPEQKKDGFAFDASTLTASAPWILLALGAGTLLATGKLPGLGKKGKKKNRK